MFWIIAEKIRTVRIGTRVIFSVQSLREFVDGKTAIADTESIACVAEERRVNKMAILTVERRASKVG